MRISWGELKSSENGGLGGQGEGCGGDLCCMDQHKSNDSEDGEAAQIKEIFHGEIR